MKYHYVCLLQKHPPGWRVVRFSLQTDPEMEQDEQMAFVPIDDPHRLGPRRNPGPYQHAFAESKRIMADLKSPGRAHELMLRKLGLRTDSANALPSRS